MNNIIYIENAIKMHPRTKLICSKFKNPEIVHIKKYGEIFNSRNQNFHLQKKKTSSHPSKKI